MPDFVAIGQTVVEISRFWIFKMAAATILDFLKFYIFLRSKRSSKTNCVTVPNVVEIAQTTAEIRQFRFFKMAAAAIFDF